ncbi:MAG: hypothetical protein Q4Q06_04315, partial [Bacteroidota bacterium]|nr:hypothetical protein [Bacteroidota bacterium]
NLMEMMKDYKYISVLPTTNFKITFDKAKAAKAGMYPKELVDGEKGEFRFSLNPSANLKGQFAQLYRQELMLLDILGSNHFERPIYVMNPALLREVIPNIMDYCVQEGIVYKIVPYKTNRQFTAKSYDMFMNQFVWGNVNKEGVYLEEAVTISNSKNMRQNHVLFAMDLIEKNEKQKAINILDKAVKEFPNSKIAFDRADVMLAQTYCDAGAKDKGKAVYKEIINYYKSYLNYYNQFKGKKARSVEGDRQMAIGILAQLCYPDVQRFGFTDLQKEIENIPEIKYTLSTIQLSNQLQQLVPRLNATITDLNTGKGDIDKAKETFVEALDLLEKETNVESMKETVLQITALIYSYSMNHNLVEIRQRIEES